MTQYINFKQRKMRRKLGNFQEQISQEMLKQFSSTLICEVMYM